MKRAVTWFLIFIIQIYKSAISPFFPPACRYYPTCSEYAMEAIEKHGPIKGLVLSITRVSRCHPFHSGGIDPVP